MTRERQYLIQMNKETLKTRTIARIVIAVLIGLIVILCLKQAFPSVSAVHIGLLYTLFAIVVNVMAHVKLKKRLLNVNDVINSMNDALIKYNFKVYIEAATSTMPLLFLEDRLLLTRSLQLVPLQAVEQMIYTYNRRQGLQNDVFQIRYKGNQVYRLVIENNPIIRDALKNAVKHINPTYQYVDKTRK